MPLIVAGGMLLGLAILVVFFVFFKKHNN